MTADNPDQDDFDPSLEGGEDFAYEEEAFGDEQFSEEEAWDESSEEAFDEVGEEEAPLKPKKKKGGLFNIVLILLALVGGGGFIYLKVLSPGGAPAPAVEEMAQVPVEAPVPDQTQTAMQAEPSVPAAPVVPEQQMALDPLLPTPADPASALPDSEVAEVLAAPAPVALTETPAATDMPAVPVPAQVEQPVEVASAPPMPAPISAPEPAIETSTDKGFNAGLPLAKDIMLTPATKSGATEAVVTAPGISADVAKSIEQKLSVLLARLDTFEGRITNLESGLHQVSGKISEFEAKPAPVADMSGINTSIKALEQKISSLEKEERPAKESAQDISTLENPTFVPAEIEKTAAPAPAASESSPQTTSVVVDTPKAELTPKQAQKTLKPVIAETRKAAGWVLRSAQPGMAMVASKSGGDMKSVSVGETLSGLGRIISIEQQGNRWVVQGTQGSLTN